MAATPRGVKREYKAMRVEVAAEGFGFQGFGYVSHGFQISYHHYQLVKEKTIPVQTIVFEEKKSCCVRSIS